MRILSSASWRRLILNYTRPWYRRFAPQLYDGRELEGFITKHHLPNGSYRQYLVEITARHCAGLDGIFLSVGVARGAAALGVMTNVKPHNDYWLIDAWDGRRTADDIITVKSGYTDDFDGVKTSFAQWPNVKFLRGLVPQVLKNFPPYKIAWAHFNLADQESEIPALAIIGPNLHHRGMIVVDAYGRPSCTDDQRLRYNEVARQCGLNLIILPSGHALAIKQ